MSECVITLSIPKIGTFKTFKSNEELDGWLWDHRGLLIRDLDGITYDLPLEVQSTNNLVNIMDGEYSRVKNATRNLQVIETIGSNESSSPVTMAITNIPAFVGRRNKETGYYHELLKPNYIERRNSNTPNPVRTGIGKDFELAFNEVAFQQNYYEQSKKPNVIKTPETVNKLRNVAGQVFKYLEDKHTVNGQKPLMRVQIGMTPKSYSKEFMASLRLAASPQVIGENFIPGADLGSVKISNNGVERTVTASGENITGIVGVADLIIIDANGDMHIYDFKCSEHPVNLDNHPDYGLQVSLYGQIGSQWEGNVVTKAILPIQVIYKSNYDPNNLAESSIDNFVFDPNKIVEIQNTDEVSQLASEWLPTIVEVNSDDFVRTNEIIDRCFTGGTLTTQERNLQLEVEEELKSKNVGPINENNKSYAAGNRIRYYKHGFITGNEKPYIDAKNEDELKEKMIQWIIEYNQKSANINTYLAKDLKVALKTKSLDTLQKIASNINHSDPSFIRAAFDRYVTNGWELVSNDLAIANGYFLFQKENLLEMIVLSTHNLFNQIHFDHGKTTRKYTSILGQFAADDQGMDSRWTFKNFYGYMELMKGMIFLGQHPEMFKSKKINKISALSLVSPGYLEESNERLMDNYLRLSALYQQEYRETLPVLHVDTEFTDDVTSFVSQATDIMLKSHDTELNKLLKDPAFSITRDSVNLSLNQIKRMINALRNKPHTMYKIGSADYNSDDWKALQYLWRAFLALKGYQISPDIRTGAITNGGIALNGHMSAPAADSPSAVVRTLHEATYSWSSVCHTEYLNYTERWKKAVINYYDFLGHNQFWGGEYNLYDRFFVHVGDKLDSRFILRSDKMPTKAEQDILDLFYEAIDRFKYGNNERKINNAKLDGSYYEVPLVISNFNERVGKRGLTKTMLDTFKKDYLVYRDFLLGVDMSSAEYKQLENIDAYELPTLLFNDNERSQKLRPKNEKDDPTTKYTTDLDYLFNAIVAEGIKREKSPEMLMVSSAIRSIVAYAQRNGANFGQDFEDSINNYVKRKIFGRPLLKEGEDRLQAAVNIIKQLTSYVTLAASGRAFVREVITGVLQGYEKTALSPLLKRRIKVSDYTDALAEIVESCYKNSDVMSWHRQLNAIYQTANFSYDQMARNSTITNLGIKNFEASDLFFTATWPDFLHRNAIIIAYLKGIGAYEAYSMVDGILTYDMKKDKRFQTFLKYTRENCPDSELHKWENEYNLYKDQYESWKNNEWHNQDGSEFKFGDMLPQALSPRDVLSLKDIADKMYGNYDEETKSLMRDTLLGSLFLQFRTYGISRAKQFFDGAHYTSDIHMESVKIMNDNGELEDLYLVVNPNKEAVANGEEMAYIPKVKSEVTLDQIRSGEAVQVRVPVGTYVSGGNVQNIFNALTTLWVFKNQEEFDEMWNKNPEYRASLYMVLIETFGMMLLAFIINKIYEGALQGDYDDIDWFTQWSYNVAIGVTQDGPLWSVIQSIVGDGAPPMLGILKNFSNNITSVITGKKDFMYGLVNSFGATRELAYLFNNR